MSFITMAKSLANGEIPGAPLSLVKTKLNEALGQIFDKTDWSFQTQQGGWLAPGLVANTGTVTVTPYSTTVVGDATASAIWTALTADKLKTLQFRDPSYSLYNIIAFSPDSGALTLDRPWLEPTSGAGRPYMIYQAFFPVPVADFRRFIEIRDPIRNCPVEFARRSQAELAVLDAQRLRFSDSTDAVPWGSNQSGYLMYELWPHQLSKRPYSFSYKRRGSLMVNLADVPPYPITEDLVTWKTKELLYQWKEAQKGEGLQRGSGANWMLLAQAAAAEYGSRLKEIRAIDANLHREFVTRRARQTAASDGYSTRTGMLNVGEIER